MNSLDDHFAGLRQEADVLRRRGAPGRAELLEGLAEEFEEVFDRWWQAPLTVAEAAEWSGYSEDRLRALAREDRLPVSRENGRIRIPRCALPRKPGLENCPEPLGRGEEDAVPSREQMARAVVESE